MVFGKKRMNINLRVNQRLHSPLGPLILLSKSWANPRLAICIAEDGPSDATTASIGC